MPIDPPFMGVAELGIVAVESFKVALLIGRLSSESCVVLNDLNTIYLRSQQGCRHHLVLFFDVIGHDLAGT